MFDWFKKKEPTEPSKPQSPEVLGLRLGGAFELDDLKLKIIEPSLIIEGAARTHLIKAVGEVQLDSQSRLIRYYTDDDGYIQILQQGNTDADVVEVKLWYFYETKPVDTQEQWDQWINHDIVQSKWELEGHQFNKVWENIKPVPMTETTWDQDGNTSITDQFVMIYDREADTNLYESLLVCGEEVIENNRAERCIVLSTGIDLSPTDFKLMG
ncbi:YjfK family protein [Vibrio sp. Of7-15]|uniref:YjfK family protein n=1 Tax=Vibrio sp. Of7-15 TaxID=2724879 RepID=UPI001EF1C434|nr:YjfK family protein [Vibrio sp. Of7-15]MCG7496403.1 YjfK family protein [Vibrio sp. Of7-15]